MIRTLKARWEKTEEFVAVDLVANITEAKTVAWDFQLKHHVTARIEWVETADAWWGRNRFVTFKLSHSDDFVELP